MSNKTEKKSETLKKNFVLLLLLTCAGAMIYGLPYFRGSYYDVFIETYNLTNTQMGIISSAFGVFGMIAYIIGGVLADKFSSKKLIIGSMFATALGGVVHYFATDFHILVVIYSVWGITSLVTFWPALIKQVRLTGDSSEQGKVFGIFEGGRGVVNTVSETALVFIFGFVSKKFTDQMGLKSIIIYHTTVLMILTFLLVIFLKENKHTTNSEDETNTVTDNTNFIQKLVLALKHPAVWLVSILLCSTYTLNIAYPYINPYATSILGKSAVFAATITIMAQYIRPFASPTGGALADKFGRANIMILGFIMMSLGLFGLIILPIDTSIVIIVGIIALIYIGMFMNYGIVMSFMDEGGIPLEISGTAIGIISTIGFLPEAVTPLVAGSILDKFKGITGYQVFFSCCIGMMIIGIITSIIWKIYLKRMKKA